MLTNTTTTQLQITLTNPDQLTASASVPISAVSSISITNSVLSPVANQLSLGVTNTVKVTCSGITTNATGSITMAGYTFSNVQSSVSGGVVTITFVPTEVAEDSRSDTEITAAADVTITILNPNQSPSRVQRMRLRTKAAECD